MRLVSAGIFEAVEQGADGRYAVIRTRLGPLRSHDLRGDVAVLVELAVEPSEYGRDVRTALRIVPPDGTGGVVIQTAYETVPERPRWQKAYRFPGLGFPMPGPYEFRFEVDGNVLATLPLAVEQES